jgi:succinate dehydrogenase / fumarate reductase iron-sulfur subunit
MEDKEKEKTVILKVQRFDPEKDTSPRMEKFRVPVNKEMTLLDALYYIKENLDSSLAFRRSCRMGMCGSCGMMVNGYPHLACNTKVEQFNSNTLTIKPLANTAVIKDLVCDLTAVFEHHKAIKPFILRSDWDEMESPTAEYMQRPDELNAFLQFTYCIKCGLCVSACPTSASDMRFLGPLTLAQCYRYCADNRDDGEDERLSIVDADHGIWHCHFAGACSEVCPKGLDPAFAIQLLKRRMVSRIAGMAEKHGPALTVRPPMEVKMKKRRSGPVEKEE